MREFAHTRYKFTVSYLAVHCGDVFDLLANTPTADVTPGEVERWDVSCVEVRELDEALQLTGLGSRKRVELAVRLYMLDLHAMRRAAACAVPCRAVPCRAVPCRAVPCCAVPCRAVLCFAVLCCAVVLYKRATH